MTILAMAGGAQEGGMGLIRSVGLASSTQPPRPLDVLKTTRVSKFKRGICYNFKSCLRPEDVDYAGISPKITRQISQAVVERAGDEKIVGRRAVHTAALRTLGSRVFP